MVTVRLTVQGDTDETGVSRRTEEGSVPVPTLRGEEVDLDTQVTPQTPADTALSVTPETRSPSTGVVDTPVEPLSPGTVLGAPETPTPRSGRRLRVTGAPTGQVGKTPTGPRRTTVGRGVTVEVDPPVTTNPPGPLTPPSVTPPTTPTIVVARPEDGVVTETEDEGLGPGNLVVGLGDQGT